MKVLSFGKYIVVNVKYTFFYRNESKPLVKVLTRLRDMDQVCSFLIDKCFVSSKLRRTAKAEHNLDFNSMPLLVVTEVSKLMMKYTF